MMSLLFIVIGLLYVFQGWHTVEHSTLKFGAMTVQMC